MYKKITEKEVANLKVGDIIFMYPIMGISAEYVEDERKVQGVHIEEIAPNGTIVLKLADVRENIVRINISASSIRKQKNKLVEDGKWWIYQNE